MNGTTGLTELFTGYVRATDEDRPLAAYGGLVGLFNAAFAGFLLGAKRSGLPIPERVGLADVLLLGVATYKLSRLLARDTVTSVLRAPFTEFEGSAGNGEVNEKPRGTGLQHALGELLTCPFCLGQWVAAGFGYSLVFAPRTTRLVASIFAMLTLADFLQLARETIEKQSE
jgi:hypothetical protein